MQIKTILHPTDFYEYSNHAFEMACSLARDQGAAVVVMHVYPPPIAHGEVVTRRQPNGYHEELLQKLRGYQAQGLVAPISHRLEEGDTVAEIMRVAEEVNCDLIVVGTHGRSGLGRLLIGSVAEQVMRKAPCPVLALKGVPSAAPPPT